jgi:fluoroquinolone transport system ATP-binding protein
MEQSMLIEVSNLFFSYPKISQPTLKGMSFEVQTGEIFGFLGPSGAGKSTTQKILIGLLKEYRGTVSVFGKELSKWKSDYYERVGVSFELPNHFLKLTALENLEYFKSLYQQAGPSPEDLLEMVGLEADGRLLVSQYSKGMKTRLSVARSFLHEPELLFLDEPTAGLDPVNARRIKDLIRAQKVQGKTIFLTTHDMQIAEELCDRVGLVVDGEIKLIDTPRNLKLQYGIPQVRVEYRVNSHTEGEQFALEGLGENPAFLDLLKSHNVETIHTMEASLEDIFIRTTGRTLL